jgi:hypothetical protein
VIRRGQSGQGRSQEHQVHLARTGKRGTLFKGGMDEQETIFSKELRIIKVCTIILTVIVALASAKATFNL